MYFKQLDSFRFFAVFLVLINHWLDDIPYVEELRLGSFGVEFFFVISGFLISLQLYDFKDKVDNKMTSTQNALYVFYWRRILRIFPLYYFVLILATLFNKGEIREAFLWNLGYMSNFYLIKVQHWTSTFSHFWSLSVEEHFYIVWPIIILLVNKKYLWPIFIFVIALSVFFRYLVFYPYHDFFEVSIHTLSCLDLFMLGAFLAYLYKYQIHFLNQFFQIRGLALFGVFIFIILYSIWFFQPDWIGFNWVYQRLFFGATYVILLGFVVKGIRGSVGRILENKRLVKLGKLSYGIYLVHNFIPGALLPIKKLGLNFIVEFIIYVMVTILVSEFLFRLVERPMRKINKHFQIEGKVQPAWKQA